MKHLGCMTIYLMRMQRRTLKVNLPSRMMMTCRVIVLKMPMLRKRRRRA